VEKKKVEIGKGRSKQMWRLEYGKARAVEIEMWRSQSKEKERNGEKDAKDGKECLFGEEEIRKHDFKGGEKCLIGDEEVWMEDGNNFAVYIFHEETRHSMEERKGRESPGAREYQPMKGELEKKIVPKVVREAVSRFKEKTNE